MRRPLRTNFVLTLSLLVLGTLVYFATETYRNSGPAPLTGMHPEEIRRIEILRKGDPPIVLEKHANHWRMLSPHVVTANAPRIETLTRIAVTPVFQELTAPSDRLREFGLAPPGIRLRLNGLELQIGTTDPIHFMRYVLGDGRLKLINDGFQHHLLASPEAFVSHFPLDDDKPIHRVLWNGSMLAVSEGEAWAQLTAKNVETADPPFSGTVLTVGYAGAVNDRAFLVPEEDKGLLIRPDLGLAYRLSHPDELKRLLETDTSSR